MFCFHEGDEIMRRKVITFFGGILFVLLVVCGFLIGGNLSHAASNSGEVVYKFDFGANTTNGFTKVDASMGYNRQVGYGFNTPWDIRNVSASGRGELSDAVQFLNTNPKSANTFNVDLPNGLYKITVTLGNTNRTSVAAENMLQLINLTGNNATDSFTIPITDGQLNILACPGKDKYAYTMSSLEIRRVSFDTTMKPTIWLCGDSTVCNYYPKDSSSTVGWGQVLGDYIDTNQYDIRNMASSGQFAKGFVDAGQFDAIEKYGKAGDYYLISIGINDTNYSNENEYYNTVTDMVKRAKAKGMTVLLVKQQGRASDVSRNPRLTGRWFGGSLDRIGREQNVGVIDLFNKALDYFISVGQDATKAMYVDDLHCNRSGAKVLARIVAENMNISVNQPIPSTQPSVTDITDDLSGIYYIQNVRSGLYLDVENGKTDNCTNIRQWTYNGLDAQKFKLVSDGHGDYYIMTGATGYKSCVDIENGSSENGTNVIQYELWGGNMQRYSIVKNNDGSVSILTKVSNGSSAIEVYAKSKDRGANVNQWMFNNGDNQHWRLIKAN